MMCIARASSVAAFSAFVLSLGGGLGCAGDEQRLSIDPPPPDDPHAASGVDHACPWLRPSEGAACELATVDVCSYFSVDDGTRTACVCGSDRQWTCLASSLGVLSPSRCSPGSDCNDGATCQTANQLCRCDAGRLRCLHE